MTEFKEKTAVRPRRTWLGLIVAAVLLAEAVLAVTMGNRKDRQTAERTAQEALAAETTEPPAPMTLDQILGADPDDWRLRLVRSDTPLPADYAPVLEVIERDEKFDARAAASLRFLIAEARADGYEVYLCSGYRSYETQQLIYQRHINEYTAQGMTPEEAHAATLLEVNFPGGSEHQLGLAADLLEYRDQPMEPSIGGSGLMLWLEQHCAEYGFIIRYPRDKTEITGVEYEPWHLRYVGPCASYIMENGLCLEEFLDQLG